jgi:hypothetical protein
MTTHAAPTPGAGLSLGLGLGLARAALSAERVFVLSTAK